MKRISIEKVLLLHRKMINSTGGTLAEIIDPVCQATSFALSLGIVSLIKDNTKLLSINILW